MCEHIALFNLEKSGFCILSHSLKSGQKEKIKEKSEENLLFIRRWVKNPRGLGSILPSSEALGKFLYKHLDVSEHGYYVEIGAGTGSLTKTLLASGIPPNRLIVLELDPDLHAFLEKILPPEVMLLCGDAKNLRHLLPPQIAGNVSTVISGIPMMNLSFEEQKDIVEACFAILHTQGSLMQFTYGPLSPLPAKKLQLIKKRVGHVLMNMPPASVWRYKLLAKYIVQDMVA